MTSNQSDKLLQATCQAIVETVAKALDAEPPGSVELIKAPNGAFAGKRVMYNATDAEKGGLLNLCRISIITPELSPVRELARIEYEHDKQGKFGLQKAYSVQSVRRNAVGELVLSENFLAADENHVRDEDFQPIHSEAYAQQTVLGTLKDWIKFRKWQLQQMHPRS
jgi:hypothetical protein